MSGTDGIVDTVNRSEPEKHSASSASQQSGTSQHSGAGRHPGEPEKRNLAATIRNAAADSNRLLLDAGVLHAREVATLHATRQFGLIPLVPDLSCVFGLLRLEQALRPRETKAHNSSGIFYVLNKFDSSLALHRDIKASLERLLGDRLLPVSLRRSDAVAEALADGMTVIDYCPGTEIAEDFVRLADWLLEWAPATFRERGE